MQVPSRRVIGVAVLLMLGFGIAVGASAGHDDNATLAAATQPRRVVLVMPAPAPTTTTTTAESKPEPKTTSTQAPPPSNEESSAPATSSPDTSSSNSSQSTDSGSGSADTSGGDTSTTDGQSTSGDSGSTSTSPGETTTEEKKPTIKHVWIFALTGHTMDEALTPNPSPMPYLAGTLRPKGLLLSKYAPAAPGGLAHLIALIGGKKPTAEQQAGCPAYNDVDPQTGAGCVFDKKVDTLPGQLTQAGRTWRAYVEDSDAAQPPDTCKHPPPGGPLEPVMARNPILFFHSIVDTPDCAANIAGISRLAPDSADSESAPTVALVIPNACHDSQDQPCTPGALAGPGTGDEFLLEQVGPLLKSKAYKDHGMVVVIFDAAPDPSKPVGALVISSAVKAGSTDDKAQDPYSLLRTIEDLFTLDPLGEAKDAKAIEVTKASR